MGQLLIIVLKYLAGILLSVEEVLHIDLRCFQLFHLGLKICKQLKGRCQTTIRVPTISTRQDDIGIPLFFWRNDLLFRTNSLLFAQRVISSRASSGNMELST
jgi:hypothetical protein